MTARSALPAATLGSQYCLAASKAAHSAHVLVCVGMLAEHSMFKQPMETLQHEQALGRPQFPSEPIRTD